MSNKLFAHRCRFVDYEPSAVTVFAFPHLPPDSPDPRALRPPILAVGHANGNIDIHSWTASSSRAQSSQAWVHLKTLAGHTGTKVDHLVLAIKDIEHSDIFSLDNLRLFSSGGGSELLEWDLVSGCVLRTVGSQGGSIWSMAINPSSTHIALGCQDGVIRIFSIADGDFILSRRLDRIKSRPLSISWGPPARPQKQADKVPSTEEDSDSDEQDDEWQDSWIAVACSDSSIRKVDVKTGHVVQRMTTERARRQRTLVWAVVTLSDGTVVSGDSLGMVKFWDSRTCTQIASYTAHGADVLCLAVGPDGNTIYSSGVDQKVAQFSLVKGTNSSPGKWIHNFSRRWHSHDVRALITWPQYQHIPLVESPTSAPYTPLLLSGGMDMSICICPCVAPTESSGEYRPLLTSQSVSSPSTFENGYYRRVPFGQSTSLLVSVAKKARLVLCRRDGAISVWKIANSPFANSNSNSPLSANANANSKEEANVEENPAWNKVVEMNLKTLTNLTASAISDDGTWIVISDYYETKLFRLTLEADAEMYTVRRMKSFGDVVLEHLPPGTLSSGAASITFTPDSRKVVLGLFEHSALVVIDLHPEAEEQNGWASVAKCFTNHGDAHYTPEIEVEVDQDGDVEMGASNGTGKKANAKGTRATVQRLAVSPDGQWLASADDTRRIHIFNLDSIKHHCGLPSFPQLVTALSFDPLSPHTLYVGLANNTFQIFDVETRLFPEWSLELCRSLPRRFTQLNDPLQGLLFEPPSNDGTSNISSGVSGGSKEVYVWGTSWMCKVSLTPPSSAAERFALSAKKRPRDGGQQGPVGVDDITPFEVVTRYRNILAMDFVASKEIVIVERPIVDILQKLPPAYFRHKYGT